MWHEIRYLPETYARLVRAGMDPIHGLKPVNTTTSNELVIGEKWVLNNQPIPAELACDIIETQALRWVSTLQHRNEETKKALEESAVIADQTHHETTCEPEYLSYNDTHEDMFCNMIYAKNGILEIVIKTLRCEYQKEGINEPGT